MAALEEMQQNPFSGDIVRLTSEPSAWRKRVGAYRIFFDVYPEQQHVDVVDIARRTSTTYELCIEKRKIRSVKRAIDKNRF